MQLRVGIIGAGAAGLCALRNCLSKNDQFAVKAFEQASCVGGTWVYSDRNSNGEKEQFTFSSIYQDLVTNLPKEVMAFPDFPFKLCLPSFVHQTEMRGYLDDYASCFQLLQHIQFETRVTSVVPLTHENDSSVVWHVECRNLKENLVEEHRFDALIVCNGHYSVPLVPVLPGEDEFAGVKLHSHDYRDPDDFEGLTVACLGAGASGVDLSISIARKAKCVYLCHRNADMHERRPVLPENVVMKPPIEALRSCSIVLRDGSELAVEALVFCTGYRYDFPFLSAGCRLAQHDGRFRKLYRHMIHIDFPSLCFVGLCMQICPFPHFDCQVKYFLSLLDDPSKIPTRHEMQLEVEMDEKMRGNCGIAKHRAHVMGSLQWPYADSLAADGGFPPLPPIYKNLYEHVWAQRRKNLVDYKQMNYQVEGGHFQEVPPVMASVT